MKFIKFINVPVRRHQNSGHNAATGKGYIPAKVRSGLSSVPESPLGNTVIFIML